MLSVHNLSIKKNHRCLFAQLSFTVKAGDICHIIGQNGSGKTTLLRLLVGLDSPDGGTIYWHGQPIETAEDYLSQLAFLGHQPAVKPQLNVYENINFFLDAPKRNAITDTLAMDDILARLALLDDKYTLTQRLSAGQRRRVALARILLSEASLWILDEPLTALDDQGQAFITQCIRAHTQQGGQVILTSHQSLDFGAVSAKAVYLADAWP